METISAFSLPPGFGFHPTDVELISHYLKRKNQGLKIDLEVIPEVDIYKFEPWDLPSKCPIPTQDSKWHFFASPGRKYPNGSRASRTTEAGYWKSTGKDRIIRMHKRVIGTKKSLVFHEGRPPGGKRSDWIMHEYCMDPNEYKSTPNIKDIFVLCRVTKRNLLEFDSVHATVKSEEICTGPKLPENVSLSVVQEDSSSLTQDNDPIEQMINELLVYDNEIEIELKEDCSSLAFKKEERVFIPDISEDFHLLHSGDDLYSGLLSDIADLDSGVPGDFYFGNIDMASNVSFSDKWTVDDSPLFACKGEIETRSDNEHASSFVNDFSESKSNLDAEIQLRSHRAVATNQSAPRFRLRVNKMVNNRKEFNQTINFDNHESHVALNGSQSCATEAEAKLEESTTSEVIKLNSSVRTRYRMRRSILPGRGCASLDLFFKVACMICIASLFMYFLLHDARRFFGSSLPS